MEENLNFADFVNYANAAWHTQYGYIFPPGKMESEPEETADGVYRSESTKAMRRFFYSWLRNNWKDAKEDRHRLEFERAINSIPIIFGRGVLIGYSDNSPAPSAPDAEPVLNWEVLARLSRVVEISIITPTFSLQKDLYRYHKSRTFLQNVHVMEIHTTSVEEERQDDKVIPVGPTKRIPCLLKGHKNSDRYFNLMTSLYDCLIGSDSFVPAERDELIPKMVSVERVLSHYQLYLTMAPTGVRKKKARSRRN